MSETKAEHKLDKVSYPVTAELHILPEVCEWDAKSYGLVNCHMTSCGELAWDYIADWRYCPFCGKPIKVVEEP